MPKLKYTPIAGAMLLLAVAATPAIWGMPPEEEGEIELDDAAIFIEINDTDGDAGIQIFLDGEDWERMKITDPDGQQLLDIRARGSVGLQGLTELFFESAEPSFDEQPLAEFLGLFPEGIYEFEGRTTDGTELEGEAELTHVLPGAPIIVLPLEDQDDVDADNTVVQWLAVADPAGSSIVGYQVIVIRESGEHLELVVDVEPTTLSITVPSEFMEEGTEYKVEVLAIEESGNKTITEREFETDD